MPRGKILVGRRKIRMRSDQASRTHEPLPAQLISNNSWIDHQQASRYQSFLVIDLAVTRSGQRRERKKSSKNLKGRDIGYALAADSCERVDNVETCTVTAPDA